MCYNISSDRLKRLPVKKLRAISTDFHNNNPFIELYNFLTSVVEFNGEFENKKKKYGCRATFLVKIKFPWSPI